MHNCATNDGRHQRCERRCGGEHRGPGMSSASLALCPRPSSLAHHGRRGKAQLAPRMVHSNRALSKDEAGESRHPRDLPLLAVSRKTQQHWLDLIRICVPSYLRCGERANRKCSSECCGWAGHATLTIHAQEWLQSRNMAARPHHLLHLPTRSPVSSREPCAMQIPYLCKTRLWHLGFKVYSLDTVLSRCASAAAPA